MGNTNHSNATLERTNKLNRKQTNEAECPLLDLHRQPSPSLQQPLKEPFKDQGTQINLEWDKELVQLLDDNINLREALLRGAQSNFFQLFSKLLEILVSQESSQFSPNPCKISQLKIVLFGRYKLKCDWLC